MPRKEVSVGWVGPTVFRPHEDLLVVRGHRRGAPYYERTDNAATWGCIGRLIAGCWTVPGPVTTRRMCATGTSGWRPHSGQPNKISHAGRCAVVGPWAGVVSWAGCHRLQMLLDPVKLHEALLDAVHAVVETLDLSGDDLELTSGVVLKSCRWVQTGLWVHDGSPCGLSLWLVEPRLST